MIFGNCPYCDEDFITAVPEGVKLPVFQRMTCGKCLEKFYEKLSRIDPGAYLPDQVVIDEENGTISLKEQS